MSLVCSLASFKKETKKKEEEEALFYLVNGERIHSINQGKRANLDDRRFAIGFSHACARSSSVMSLRESWQYLDLISVARLFDHCVYIESRFIQSSFGVF
jgi:hypothetical protein